MSETTQNKEMDLKEEYELWRKNCRYMYEFVSETALTWPSLTVQWLPLHTTDDVINARLLLGTHTSGEDQNYLKLASTKLPIEGSSSVTDKPKVSSIIKISKKFATSHEINRARYMPHDENIVATINGDGESNLFNLESGDALGLFRAHSENGYGLSWNPLTKGLLLTGSDDHTVVTTDTNKISNNSGLVQRFQDHRDVVNDVKWHNFDANIFASVSDDCRALLYDLRTSQSPVSEFCNKELNGINSLAFSPFSRNLLAVGNLNSNITLLDLRKLSGTALHTMMGHGDAITSMEFSPHKDGILASGSQDRRVIIWDLSKIGEEQAQEDAEDGSPEIYMMHAGHTGGVTDLSWCPFVDWTLASAADDNIVHLWQVSKSLVNEEQAAIDDSSLE